MTDDQRQKVIEGLQAELRTVFVALIFACVYTYITVWTIRDEDFFTGYRTIVLPFFGNSAPINFFFLFASILITFLYIFYYSLLVMLEKHYSEFRGSQPEFIVGTTPPYASWIFGDDDQKAIYGIFLANFAAGVTLTLAPLVIGLLWWSSLVKHDLYFSLLISLFLLGCLYISFKLLITLKPKISSWLAAYIIYSKTMLIAVFLMVPLLTLVRTSANYDLPVIGPIIARSELESVFFTRIDTAYSDRHDWARQFGASFNERTTKPLLLDHERTTFDDEFARRRKLYLSAFETPSLDRGRLSFANLKHSVILGTRARHAHFDYAQMQYMQIEDVDFLNSSLVRANLDRSRILSSDFTLADMTGAFARHASLDESYFEGTHIRGANFNDSSLKYSYLKNIEFENVKLNKTDLNGAYIIDSTFTAMELRSDQFSGAFLSNVLFDKSVKLDRAVFRNSKLDSNTIAHLQTSHALNLSDQRDEYCLQNALSVEVPFRTPWWSKQAIFKDQFACAGGPDSTTAQITAD
ncbi:pentapeptide repeat-containing protein [Fulvimarina sp. MAC8]|uniref:pentapeptide repeat-containing protein n=1 Tax=Fulvimarina sp. MAC8 TaxID=3162874 RepID=UPI0032EDBBFB